VVFAASSLTDAMNEAAAEFRKANPGIAVTFSFASSSALRTQIAEGAKADVFASADESNMAQAASAGVIDGTPTIFARNSLALVVPSSNAKVASMNDLVKADIKLVLAATGVPVRTYTEQVLAKAAGDPKYGPEYPAKVKANLASEAQNVRQAVTQVKLGQADVTVAYITDVAGTNGRGVRAIPVPEQYNVVAAYPIAPVKGSTNSAAARAFIAFLTSPKGQTVLQKYGFASP